MESATTYFTGDAVPVNVESGTNVTVPFAFTVYVPWPATSRVSRLQLAFAVDVVSHNFTEVAIRVAPVPAASPVKTSITWLVLYAPLEVSLSAVGGGGTIGVNVEVAF